MFPPQGSAKGGVITQKSELLVFPCPRVTLADTESLVLAQFTLPTGKACKVWKAQIANDAGASVTGLTIEVYDNTNALSVYSTSNNVVQEGTPLATSNTGVEIIIRISNNSGGSVNCQGFVAISIE